MPIDLYYSKSQQTSVFIDEQTDELDVQRFIEQKPCWKKTTLTDVRQKKKIVISDWTAENWSIDRQIQVADVLNRLISEQFEIYIYSDNELIPSDKATKEHFFNMNPAPIADVLSQSSEVLKCPVDHIQVLDDYDLDCLIENHETPPVREIKASLILNSKFISKQLSARMKECQPKIINIVQDVISDAALKSMLILSQVLKCDVNPQCLYNAFDLRVRDKEKSYFYPLMPTFKKEWDVNPHLFQYIRKLVVDDSCEFDYFVDLLAISEALTSLTIYCSSALPQVVLSNIAMKAQLTALSITTDAIGAHFETVIPPNLQHLTIIGSLDALPLVSVLTKCKSLRSLTINEPLSVHEMEELQREMPQLVISVASVQDIKKNTSNVKARSISPTPISNVRHDHRNQFSYKRAPTPDEFSFKPHLKDQDQKALMNKLAQFILLNNLDLAIMDYVSAGNGICKALSQWFIEDDKAEQHLKRLAQWNGKDLSDEDINASFNRIYQLVKDIYIRPSTHESQLLACDDDTLLNVLPHQGVIENPWHAIAIKKQGIDEWIVYDPNYKDGPKRLTTDALIPEIREQLGDLISLNSRMDTKPLVIKDPNRFIEQGGLLALCNSDNVTGELIFSLGAAQYTAEALHGLRLRATNNKPAWVIGLEKPSTKSFTFKLLSEYMTHVPDALDLLQDSVAELTPYQRHEILVCLCNTKELNHRLRDRLCSMLRTSPTAESYCLDQMATWRKRRTFANSIDEYCQSLFTHPHHKKMLVEFSNHEAIIAFELILQNFCKKTSRPVFYVDKPDDLICQKPSIKSTKQGVTTLTSGPSGRLYDFISAQNEAGHAPVIVVNYAHFKPQDLIRFNTLLDETRTIDGVDLPENIRIIGLNNSSAPGAYQGSDFFSRMDYIDVCPFASERLIERMPRMEFEPFNDAQDVFEINLCESEDWLSRLLGKWVIKSHQLVAIPGLLHKAFASDRPILIKNAPWDDLSFRQFFHQFRLDGSITTPAGELLYPEGLRLVSPLSQKGYDWEKLIKSTSLRFVEGLNDEGEIINSARFQKCFEIVAFDIATSALTMNTGWIEQHQGKTLVLNITHALSEDEWGRMLIECEAFNVSLKCRLSPSMSVPSWMLPYVDPIVREEAHITLPNNVYVQTNDPSSVIARLKQDNPETKVIDVSECTVSELLKKLDGKFDKANTTFQFSEQNGVVHDVLTRGETVVLTGQFSTTMAQELAPLLLGRHPEYMHGGKIHLVGSNLSAFGYLNIEHYLVDEEQKKNGLLEQGFTQEELSCLTEDQWHLESLNQLKARVFYHKLNKDECTNNAWQGIHQLDIHWDSPSTIDLSESTKITQTFNQKRIDAVANQLTITPYVLLTGLTAVGKSTFVEQNYPKAHHSVSNMVEWALDDTQGMKVLFIDESNLMNRQWSEFEGLFERPPSIVIKGQYYPLTPQHKVIFAANPLNYGDRILPELFKQHGSAVVFDPFPNALIFENIIKPVFKDLPIADDKVLEMSQVFLEYYNYVCKQSTQEVLMSAREVQMMALFAGAYLVQHKEADAKIVAQYYGYELASSVLSSKNLASFQERFVEPAPLERPSCEQGDRYRITSSRIKIKNQLEDLLSLRQLRIEHVSDNLALLYGGLGGIIIEGSPGIGKSDLVMSTLVEHNKKVDSLMRVAWYHIPASASIDQKKQMLLSAFDEGAIVVMDEINSTPFMEALLNDLLMGKSPDKKPPKKPGFMLIGTQNPTSMAGREQTSNALSRRLFLSHLPDYTASEMIQILEHLSLTTEQAISWVNAFIKQSQFAKTNHKTPQPTFRDLITKARVAQDDLKKNYIVSFMTDEEALDEPFQTNSDNSAFSIAYFIAYITRWINSLYLIILYLFPPQPNAQKSQENNSAFGAVETSESSAQSDAKGVSQLENSHCFFNSQKEGTDLPREHMVGLDNDPKT